MPVFLLQPGAQPVRHVVRRRDPRALVFCESRQTVEELGAMLRGKGVATLMSHASLSADERRRSEQAFAEARDCVVVSTSISNSASTSATSTA